MFGKTIKLSKEVYEDIIAERDKARKELQEHLLKKMDEDKHRQDQYYEIFSENIELKKQNACLKTLIDKEGDTQVIKYNGKLYRVVSTSHFHDEGEADTIDISAVIVSEVG